MTGRLNHKEPEVNNDLFSHIKKSNCSGSAFLSMRSGKLCPYCGDGIVEYDSFLNLICPKCKKIETGAYT